MCAVGSEGELTMRNVERQDKAPQLIPTAGERLRSSGQNFRSLLLLIYIHLLEATRVIERQAPEIPAGCGIIAQVRLRISLGMDEIGKLQRIIRTKNTGVLLPRIYSFLSIEFERQAHGHLFLVCLHRARQLQNRKYVTLFSELAEYPSL